MSNPFYSDTGSPGPRSFGSSAAIRAEFAAIQAAFDKMGTLSGNSLKLVRVNAGETGYEPDPNVYLTAALAAAGYVSKLGDTMAGALNITSGGVNVSALAGYGFVQTELSASAVGGLEVKNISATRVLELLHIGSTAAPIYGGGVGDVVLNASGGGNIVLSTLDLPRGFLNATGLGLGATPDARLTVVSGSVAALRVGYLGGSVNYYDADQHIFRNASASLPSMQTNSSSNVGIGGTPDATAKLLLQAASGLMPSMIFNKVSAGAAWRIGGDGTAANDLSMGLNAGTSLTLLTSGGVQVATALGIGAAPGSGPLRVFGAYGEYQSATYHGYLGQGDAVVSGGATTDFALASYSGHLLFGAGGGTERMRLASTGNFGIGTAAPQVKLHVKSTSEAFRIETTTARGSGTNFFSFYDPSGFAGFLGYGGASNDMALSNGIAGALTLATNGINGLVMDTAGVLTEKNGRELGYRVIPRTTSLDGATLNTSYRGLCNAGNFTSLTIPANQFAAGDAVMVYQDGAASMTLTQGASLTMRLAGSATTGSRTLAGRGMATIWFNSATECIVSGAGVT